MCYYLNMKKIFALFVLALIVIPAFSQEEDWKGNRLMAVTLSPNPFIIGTAAGGFGISPGFEYAFIPSFSAKAQLYFLVFSPEIMFYGAESNSPALTFRASAEGRWYPMENNVHGLFASGGLQYQRTSGSFKIVNERWVEDPEVKDIGVGNDGKWEKTYTKFKDENTLGFYAGLGYKFIFGKRRTGLVIEPVLDYIWSVYMGSEPVDMGYVGIIWPIGTHGLRFTLNLGVAF